MDSQVPLSCVLYHDVTEQANNMYATDSVTGLLGWTPKELNQMSFFSLVHREEVEAAKNLHYELIRHDKARTLTYLRLLHKGDDNTYALCALSRSVAKNFVVGTISLATDDPGNARAALATGGVFVLTPTAHRFSFRPYSVRVNLSEGPIYTGPPNGYPPLSELPEPSDREALLLDRFSGVTAPVLHCSNKCIFTEELPAKENLYKFILDPKDQKGLKDAVDVVKSWITTVEGPVAGPFTTCQFKVSPPESAQRRVEGILIATSDAILLTLVPLDEPDI